MTVEEPAAPAESRVGPRERVLLVVLGIVVLLGGLFFLLTSGGGDDDDPVAVPPPRPTVTATPTTSPLPTEPPLVETDDSFIGRDPFQPLVTAEEPGEIGSEPGIDDGEVPDDGNTGDEPTDDDIVGGGDVDGDGSSDEARRVTLLDIFSEDGERFATVEVEGDQYTVGEGETFADNFRLLDLTRECGTFVFGDERFTLCIGQEVRK